MGGLGWRGCAKKGLLIDDEKQRKARRLLEKGSDKVAYDILKQLADGPRRPAELRAALGIASANFFSLFCIMGHGHRNGKRRTSQLSAA